MQLTLRSSSLALAALSSVILSACGGGSSSSSSTDTSVPLETSADVLQEMTVVTSAVSTVGTVSGGVSSPSSSGTTSAARVALARLPMTNSIAVSPAAVSGSCPDGGTDTVTNGVKQEDFAYFSNQSLGVADQTDVYTGCIRSASGPHGSVELTLNGTSEAGATPQSVNGEEYAYVVAGSGTSPLNAVVSGSNGGSLNYQLLGNIESEANSGAETTGAILSLDYSSTSASGSSTAGGEFDLGSGTTPFYFTSTQSPASIAFNGPYEYHGASCTGGTASVATMTALTSTENADGTSYISGGVVTFTTDKGSATITFDSEGNASISFSNGSTGTLTSAQIQQAMAAGACGLS